MSLHKWNVFEQFDTEVLNTWKNVHIVWNYFSFFVLQLHQTHKKLFIYIYKGNISRVEIDRIYGGVKTKRTGHL